MKAYIKKYLKIAWDKYIATCEWVVDKAIHIQPISDTANICMGFVGFGFFGLAAFINFYL